jgi:hypothetical protein
MSFSGGIKGGGLFTGDGTLHPFTFSAIAPGDKKAGQWAYIVLAFQADGKDKVDTQHLFLGGVDRYQFEEGGTTAKGLLKDGSEAPVTTIGKSTPAGRFFSTLVKAGTAVDIESVLPDLTAGEPLNFDGLVGARVSLGQEVDVKGTAEKGQKTGSDGVKRDRTNTIVEAVYAVGEKPAAKGASKSASRTNGSGKSANVNAARDKADAIVLGLIADAQKADKKNKTGETPVSKFKMAALRALAKDADKEAVTELLADDGYRNDAMERGVFGYDSDAETVSAL